MRNLIERHGGTVSAISAGVGHGSEFVVRLPRVAAADGTGDDAGADTADNGRTSAASSPVRVLVVDDNQDGADMLAAALGAKGFETRVAHDAPTALEIAPGFAPHVAFLDIGLPVMDGYELASRLRQLPGMARVLLVAVTGYGQESDRRRTAEAGFHHHLVKPVDLLAIDAVVATVDARDTSC